MASLSSSPSHAQDAAVDPLYSNILVDPIRLPPVEPEAKISRLKLFANFEDAPTMAELELDMSKFEFNDFGDPIRMGASDVKKMQVHLTNVTDQIPNSDKKFQIYEVKEFQQPKYGMRLVVSTNFKHTDNYRKILLVLYQQSYASDLLNLRPQHELDGANSLESKLQDERWRCDPLRVGMSLKTIAIDQWQETTARLHLDPNSQTWSADGLTVTSTLMGWQPRQVNLIDTKMVDPQNRGRKLWELTEREPRRTRYFVVEDQQGKHHRLVIKIDEKIRYISPLVPSN